MEVNSSKAPAAEDEFVDVPSLCEGVTGESIGWLVPFTASH